MCVACYMLCICMTMVALKFDRWRQVMMTNARLSHGAECIERVLQLHFKVSTSRLV